MFLYIYIYSFLDYLSTNQTVNQFKITNNFINQTTNYNNDLIDLVKKQNDSTKPNLLFNEIKQKTNYEALNNNDDDDSFNYSVKLNHLYDLPKTKSTFNSPKKMNSINLSDEINSKNLNYNNYYHLAFASKLNINSETQNCFNELNENNKILNNVQSFQCVPAIICYKKSNYALVYSSVTQSLAILLKSSFNE